MIVITNTELGWDCVVGIYDTSSTEEACKMFGLEHDWESIPTESELSNMCYVLHKMFKVRTKEDHEYDVKQWHDNTLNTDKNKILEWHL